MKSNIIRFYFDPLSPYAWLAWRPLMKLASQNLCELMPIPTLFAGLLNSNGQLGPAEIPNKRIWILKDVARRAHRQGLKVNIPPFHPFNPLLSLRACSVDMDHSIKLNFVTKILDAVWSDGKNVEDNLVIQNLAESVGLNGKDLVNLANSQDIKAKLRNQTEEAISLGVFGVPTVQVGRELFWGSETDTLLHIEDAVKGVDNYDRSLIEKWVNIKPSAVRIKKE